MCKVLFVKIVLLTVVLAEEKIRYDNYKVYTVIPRDIQQIRILQNLDGYDFWSRMKGMGLPVDIMVPPELRRDFENVTYSNKIPVSVKINNVQEKIGRTTRKRRSTFEKMHWYDYRNGDEINSFLKHLSEVYPKQVKLLNIGKTYENRDIIGVHVSFSKINSVGKRSIFIEGGIHAREWISPATATFILNEILATSNITVRNLVRLFDWYFFPIFNPDGYAFTFAKDRLWRNTRKPHGCPFQLGADPNRNWGDEHWLEIGSSDNPCSSVYAGSTPFSENCTRVLANYIETIGHKLLAYISFHSYGQVLIIPYGHTAEHLSNYEEMKAIGSKAIKSLSFRYGTHYEIGNAAEVVYPVAGSSMDWVKQKFNTRIVYSFELRDEGKHGFLLPSEEIIPTAQETLDSLIAILREARKLRS